MPLPEITDEQRSAALVKAQAARQARVAFKTRLTRGEMTLAQALHDAATDDVIGKTRVVDALTALPRVGNATAYHIMIEVQISPTRRLRGLGVRQRHALLTKLGLPTQEDDPPG